MSGPKALEWDVESDELTAERALDIARERCRQARLLWETAQAALQREGLAVPDMSALPYDIRVDLDGWSIEAVQAVTAALRDRTATCNQVLVHERHRRMLADRLTTQVERRERYCRELGRPAPEREYPEDAGAVQQAIEQLYDENLALHAELAAVRLGADLAAQLTPGADLEQVAVPLRLAATETLAERTRAYAEHLTLALPDGVAAWTELEAEIDKAAAAPFRATVHLHAIAQMVAAAGAADELAGQAEEQLSLLQARATCSGDPRAQQGVRAARAAAERTLHPPYVSADEVRRELSGMLAAVTELVDQAEQAAQQRRQREFVLTQVAAALTELGYHVAVGMETYIPGEGVIARVPGSADHAVWAEIEGGQLGLQVVRTGDSHDERGAVQAEQHLCAVLPDLRRSLAGRGVSTDLTQAYPPGSVPLRQVAVPSAAFAPAAAARRQRHASVPTTQ